MALLKAYSIRDAAIDAFNSPFCVPAPGVAARYFTDLVNDRQTPYSKHPEDYDLYFVGTFETDNGSLLGEKVVLVVRGKDVYRPDPAL